MQILLRTGYLGAEEPLLARATPGVVPLDGHVLVLKGSCRLGMCLFSCFALMGEDVLNLEPDDLAGLVRPGDHAGFLGVKSISHPNLRSCVFMSS